VHFLGLLGPNGPLPLHLTEYARDRERNAGDPTLVRFLDVFHHRILSLFYRAWADGQPTVSFDRPAQDRFAVYLGSLFGLGMPSLRERDEFPDRAKLYFAGRLAAQPRNAEGLAAIVGEFFGLPVAIEEFVGEWLTLPEEARWRLGRSARLAQTTVAGARTWQRQSKFRIVFGPLGEDDLQSLLPGGRRLRRLLALVRNYVGDSLSWDVRLQLKPGVSKPFCIGGASRIAANQDSSGTRRPAIRNSTTECTEDTQAGKQEVRNQIQALFPSRSDSVASAVKSGASRLGWTSWLGRCPRARQDVILNPLRPAAHCATGANHVNTRRTNHG